MGDRLRPLHLVQPHLPVYLLSGRPRHDLLQGVCPSKPRSPAAHTRASGRLHPQAAHHTTRLIESAHTRARTQAPELFAYPPVISAAADVYAFAVLAWVVCTREQPYQNLQSADTAMASMLNQGVRPELPDGDDWRDATTAGLAELIEP